MIHLIRQNHGQLDITCMVLLLPGFVQNSIKHVQLFVSFIVQFYPVVQRHIEKILYKSLSLGWLLVRFFHVLTALENLDAGFFIEKTNFQDFQR